MNAIELSRLEKRFGSVRALDRVTASLPQGTITLLAGSNGAGKTTLLRILASLTRPTRGTVRVLEVDPFGREGAAWRSRVGYLGQEAGLYGELRVRENLEFCAKVHGINPRRVDALLRELGLEAVADQRASTLSLGYLRRAGLARAQLTEPSLLLLDEPWNGLDAEASQQLSQQLRSHRQAGRSALVAAHNPDAAQGLFDGVLRLERGHLVESHP